MKTKLISLAKQKGHGRKIQWTNQNSKQIWVGTWRKATAKRGKPVRGSRELAQDF